MVVPKRLFTGPPEDSGSLAYSTTSLPGMRCGLRDRRRGLFEPASVLTRVEYRGAHALPQGISTRAVR